MSKKLTAHLPTLPMLALNNREMTSEAHLKKLKSRIEAKQAVLITGTGVASALCGDNPPPFVTSWAPCIVALGKKCQETFELDERWWKAIGFGTLQDPRVPPTVDDIALVSEKLFLWHEEVRGAWSDFETFNYLAYKVFANLQVGDKSIAKALEGVGIPIMTTNYDTLLELATPRIPLSLRKISQNGWSHFIDGDHPGRGTVHSRFVVHVHGTFHDTKDIVLSPSQYANTMDTFKDTIGDLVTGVFTKGDVPNQRTMSLIFVGAKGTVVDHHFKSLWKELKARGSTSEHYILVTDDEVEETLALLNDYDGTAGLRVISYGKNFGDLTPFVHSLKPAG